MDKYENYGLEDVLNECHSIAWDTCHKIYVLMDAEQADKLKGYGYEALIEATKSNPYDLLDEVKEWYDSSCSLKFIDVVYTTDEGIDKFYPLVAQGENILEVM